jgi:hypothetical protein
MTDKIVGLNIAGLSVNGPNALGASSSGEKTRGESVTWPKTLGIVRGANMAGSSNDASGDTPPFPAWRAYRRRNRRRWFHFDMNVCNY